MQGRTQRADKQQDRSVRSGTGPVQQLHKNAQNITGTVQNLERKLHELDTGKVAALRSCWAFHKHDSGLSHHAFLGSHQLVADIAADLVGKQGFESHLATLTRKKEDLQKKVDVNKQWTVCTCSCLAHWSCYQPVQAGLSRPNRCSCKLLSQKCSPCRTCLTKMLAPSNRNTSTLWRIFTVSMALQKRYMGKLSPYVQCVQWLGLS